MKDGRTGSNPIERQVNFDFRAYLFITRGYTCRDFLLNEQRIEQH